MRSRTLLLWAFTLALPLSGHAAEEAQHHHHGTPSAHLQLDHGRKWATDEALRTGMLDIRAKVTAALADAHSGKLTPARYDALGKNINARIAEIVRSCKLEPKADAQLHVVIGELMQSAETLEGKERGRERTTGLVRAAEALNAYGTHFEHAGWTAIRLTH